MSLAYIILFHKNPNQLFMLVDRLNEEKTTFIIHVCNKTPKNIYTQVKNHFSMFKNVHFCKRENGRWGAFGIVQGTINAISMLIEKKIQFEYLNLISAQDYPIKSNSQIKEFFHINKGLEFLDITGEIYSDNPIVKKAWGNQRFMRYEKYWIPSAYADGSYFCIPEKRFENKNRIYIIKTFFKYIYNYYIDKSLKKELLCCIYHFLYKKDKPRLANFSPVAGSQWFSISYECAVYVLEKSSDKRIRSYFRSNLLSDESFFNSIVYNSAYKNKLANTNLRHIEWTGTSHPRNLNFSDYLNIVKIDKVLFARKFEETDIFEIECYENMNIGK